MITIKQIAEKSMTEEKRRSAKNDIFAFYIGRPLSYILTIPFLYTNIKPNTVSLISFIPQIIGFVLFCVTHSISGAIAGWFLFFLWNLLDGVDGNIARFKREFSRLGSVYDAASGYMACALTFFSMGIAAAHMPGVFSQILHLDRELLIIAGGLSGIFTLFPRLVLHKAKTATGGEDIGEDLMDREHYDLFHIVALNLKSVTGGAQALMLVAIVAGITDLYTICYFFFNMLVMLVSLRSILKEK
ncbi:MAG: CDP-alcohol phosphatidyltransferase family protein [Lachnospiraceae bacterium]|nr:CDP-alcohol phosphatidyltransferase family protein [Lachnospiraceae bacterium]